MKSTKRISVVLVLTMLFTLFAGLPATAVAEETTVTTTATTTTTEEVVEANTIDIITFNDFHGNVAEDTRDWGKNLGMSKMVGKANELKAANPNTIFIAGGDNYQGTATSNLTHGAPVTDMMKAMGVVASAVGNHEFDWGREWITKWAEEGNFTYLASNIYDTATNEPVEWAKPYMVIEQGGIKIGLIGLAHQDTLTLTKAEHVSGLEFRDPIVAAQEWIDFLQAGKAEEGTPDVIIAVTHLDSKQDSETKVITGTAAEVAEGVTGLDAIISAHSHKTVAGNVNEVAIVQAYKYGRSLGKLAIELNEDGTVKDVVATVDNTYKTKSDIIPDAATQEVFASYEEKVGPVLNEKVGTATAEFDHELPNVTQLGLWTCEVMAEKAGTDIAVQNGGGLRRSLYAGDITMGDMYEIMPYDNQLIKMDLPGKDLKAVIENGLLNPDVRDGSFSGLKAVYDPKAEFGSRLVSLTLLDGTPIEDDKLYSVATNDFIFTGGDKYNFTNAQNDVDTFIPIRDVMVDAIKATGSISPKTVDVLTEKTVDLEMYTVVAGDVLWKIARDNKTTIQVIVDINQILDPNFILVGQQLKLPVE
ncbi:LysM peptidoglycan-binding domain-containing protein [Acidaminobacter sp. JC074]|uniref:5'-nucleotidase C-terminal domain-containing protein n=1 Tax=Acidaminobacter sp. JC074 TaxID=2530199 RepID=UPI001F0D7220|nr:5'-nucleotidase C-terminal domain-containing protein [Acidaminobacter sp. JC074]MCH4888339.1 LysM peptidoglycan-binding domain-containing protein [Acidaminobacter sp. JC074]